MCHFVVFVKSSRVTSIDFGVFFTKSSHRPDFFHLFTWSNVCVEGAEIVRCPIFSICFNLKCMKTKTVWNNDSYRPKSVRLSPYFYRWLSTIQDCKLLYGLWTWEFHPFQIQRISNFEWDKIISRQQQKRNEKVFKLIFFYLVELLCTNYTWKRKLYKRRKTNYDKNRNETIIYVCEDWFG